MKQTMLGHVRKMLQQTAKIVIVVYHWRNEVVNKAKRKMENNVEENMGKLIVTEWKGKH